MKPRWRSAGSDSARWNLVEGAAKIAGRTSSAAPSAYRTFLTTASAGDGGSSRTGPAMGVLATRSTAAAASQADQGAAAMRRTSADCSIAAIAKARPTANQPR